MASNATTQGPRGLRAGRQRVSKCACASGPWQICIESSSSLIVRSRLCVVGLPGLSYILIISPPVHNHLNSTSNIASVAGGAGQVLKRGSAHAYANHLSAAALRSELIQHHFRIASPDSAGPTVFEDQTDCR